MSELVYRLGSSPWPNKRVGFGVSPSQAARSPRFQPHDGVLWQKIRWHIASKVFFPLPMGMERENRCE